MAVKTKSRSRAATGAHKEIKVKRVARKKIIGRKGTTPKSKSGKEVGESFNRVKYFGGTQYTGMQVGRSHKWYYDKGEWKDTKITPDLWSIAYKVTKRRAGKAPKGSGAAIGTGYHWFIIAHQNVLKLNEDDYSTSLTGLKFKLSHKRADKGKWNSSGAAQRKRAIRFLQEMIRQLQSDPIPLEFNYKDTAYKGDALPVLHTYHDGRYDELYITLNNEHIGIIRRLKNNWKMELAPDQKFIDAIGHILDAWFGS